MLSLWKKLIFHKDEYDPKGHERSHKTRLAKFFFDEKFLLILIL